MKHVRHVDLCVTCAAYRFNRNLYGISYNRFIRVICCLKNKFALFRCTFRLLKAHPEYKEVFASIKDITDEEELRHNDDFENDAMDIYQVFDEVIANLEAVDNALKDIERGAGTAKLTRTMWKVRSLNR